MNVAQYTITGEIYQGAGALLCRGYRTADGTPVTIKLLQDEHLNPRAVAKLRHEYAILKDLDLPGVVKSYGLVEHGKTWGLVLEDLGGEPLHQVMGRQRLDLGTTLALAASLAGTLAALHARKVIHKDVKPHNVLVHRAALATKLIDFGIATRLSREAQNARSPEALEGTLAYMSPEQTGRTNRLLDHRTDLYSFGVMLYEMLTGALPFQATDAMELVHSHLARRPPAPHDLLPGLPRVVSDITMRLLEKAAEDRYQSARGLEVDLDECRAQLSATGKIEPFPLGQKDQSGELHVPQKLYGREAELKELEAAWNRASRGSAELMLITGSSGLGKSALVAEMVQPVVRRGGHFIAGKFDQLSRATPYAAVAHAFRELVRRVLMEPAAALGRWKQRLLQAVGASGQVLVDLIPELELILGPQPSAPALGASESQARFQLLFQSFVRLFTTRERPLAIFLDDLQWADPASLKLVELLLSQPERGHLLVLGAYRDSEVDAGHPLQVVLGDLRSAGASVGEIKLGPLALGHVGELIAEAFGCDPERVAPLAEVVRSKTGGNPFFVNQFLEAIHQRGLLAFDAGQGSWTWDSRRIQEAMVTDNVIDLMASKIQRLPEGTQRALELAACVGHEFDLRTLSIVHQRPLRETGAALWEALREGLVLPLDGDYRLLDAPEAPGDPGPELPAGFNVAYRFLHDRVQQAAYSLLEDDKKQEAHLSIGRLLLAESGGSPRDEDLFEVTDHLHRGAALIREPSARLAVARLSLAAGQRAKASVAYQAAVSYLRGGAALLEEASWEGEYELAFALHVELAECAYLTGAFAEAEALFDALLGRARSNLDRAHVHDLRVVLYATAGKYEEALSVGWTALALFDVVLPAEKAARGAAVQASLAEVRAKLAGRRPEELLDAPLMSDPDRRMALRILIDLATPAFFIEAAQFTFAVAKMVDLSLTHGNSDLSAYGYTLYGVVLTSGGHHQEGYEFGRLSRALCEKLPSVQVESKVITALASNVSTLCEPLRNAIGYAVRGRQLSLEAGDLPYLIHSAYHSLFTRLGAGDPLGALRDDIGDLHALMQRVKNAPAVAVMAVGKQLVAALMGETKGAKGAKGGESLSDGSFDEEAFRATLQQPGWSFVACWYYTVKLELALLYGDFEGAVAMARLAEQSSTGGEGFYFTTELLFHACLARAMLADGGGTDGGGADAAALAADMRKLASWAESCPETFLHKKLLVEAAQAHAAGNALEALDKIDQAIEAARQNGFVHHQALASELAAKFNLARGRARAAALHLSDAYASYLQWGAMAKAEDLEERYGQMLLSSGGAAPRASVDVARGARGGSTDAALASTTVTTTTTGTTGAALDVATVIRAAQALAGEIVLESVLDRVMRSVIENAGAQRGLLLLSREGQLMVEASITVQPDAVTVGPAVPVEQRDDLALSVVHYVERTKEPVVVGDASRDGRYAADPYVAARRPRSLLCLAMTHQGKLTGILYLENNAAADVFTPARIELCRLIASQAAVAVENALLVARVKASKEALLRVNEELEVQIAGRTEELRHTNERLTLELRERERSEAERMKLQEEIIRTQTQRLSEMSTPFIPITERIMVMPLVGTMDAERSRQVLEAALEGAQSRSASVVIIDITGVKIVDTDVASSLIKTAAALRLLGAQAVLTGVRPEVAQALVALNIDLEGLVTKGTLQSGILHALRRSGEARLFQMRS